MSTGEKHWTNIRHLTLLLNIIKHTRLNKRRPRVSRFSLKKTAMSSLSNYGVESTCHNTAGTAHLVGKRGLFAVSYSARSTEVGWYVQREVWEADSSHEVRKEHERQTFIHVHFFDHRDLHVAMPLHLLCTTQTLTCKTLMSSINSHLRIFQWHWKGLQYYEWTALYWASSRSVSLNKHRKARW
jgi:hypothetical protein